jgi:hypothetical protein
LEPAANSKDPIPGFSDKLQSLYMRIDKTPFPVSGIVKDLVAEEPNLSGSIQRLCRLGHIIAIVHDISLLKIIFLTLNLW